jgi:hypothetical protein
MKHVVHKESQAMKTDDLICLWMRMSLFALFLLVMCVASPTLPVARATEGALGNELVEVDKTRKVLFVREQG